MCGERHAEKRELHWRWPPQRKEYEITRLRAAVFSVVGVFQLNFSTFLAFRCLFACLVLPFENETNRIMCVHWFFSQQTSFDTRGRIFRHKIIQWNLLLAPNRTIYVNGLFDIIPMRVFNMPLRCGLEKSARHDKTKRNERKLHHNRLDGTAIDAVDSFGMP